MIRAFLYLLAVAVLAAVAVWFAERPGEVTIAWGSRRIETSLIVAGLVLLLLIGLSIALFWMLLGLLHAPASVRRALKEQGKRRRERIIVEGLLAVSAGDHLRGRKLAAEARRIAPDEPLSLLLEAQAAQLEGRTDRADEAFRAMLKAPEARLLGLRGLFVSARRGTDVEAARRLAQEAFDIAPTAAWSSRALLDLHGLKRDWTGALVTLAQLEREGVLDRDQASRQRSVLWTAQAIEREARDPIGAARLADEALIAAPDLVPAAVIAARRASVLGDIKTATRILERSWKHEPHPDLAELYADIRPGDSAQDRLVRVQRLVRIRANHEEGLVALGRAAVKAQEWRMAREALAPLLRGRPQARVCALMAEVEMGENSDQGRAREWLSRALRASPDPAWTSENYVSMRWLPVSPLTGAIDTFRWKVPVEAVGGVAIEAEKDRLAAEALASPKVVADASATAAAARPREEEKVEPIITPPPPKSVETPPPPPPRLESRRPSETPPRPSPRPRAPSSRPAAVVTPLPLPNPVAEAVAPVDEDRDRHRAPRPDDPGVADDVGPTAARRFGIF